MGSKKHKRHKEKEKKSLETETSGTGGEQKPLKLVLKVPQTYSSAHASAPIGHSSHSSHDGDGAPPPKLMAFGSTQSGGGNEPSSSSSSKKMKKKKSKKKHRKHSHHHSRHRHHSHHHRHRGSCSHHSRQSQDSNASLSLALSAPSKSPQKSLSSSCSKSTSKSQFQHLLSHLLKQLQRKDIQQFFAWPVSNLIAPGYSSIISHPMDLSTIKQKIDMNQYETLIEFKADVKLMCDNAMKYNRPETVYYKAANKLWHYTRAKLMSKDSLIELAHTYTGLSSYELGFHFDEPSVPITIDIDIGPETVANGQSNNALTNGESLLPVIPEPQELHEAEVLDEDGLSPEQILEEAKKAAAAAADRLTLQRPKGAHFSFLRQRNDGSTTMSIVGNHNYEKVINLESLVGKLNDGTAALSPFKESENNRVKPIVSINESPFTSYLPSIDSSNATLNEHDTALLLSAYGDDELGLQYAQSLTQFANDTDYVLHLVDSLLDVLTHGQHTKIAMKLKEQQIHDQNGQSNNGEPSLPDESMDEIQDQLNETGTLIEQLNTIQHQRLSSATQTVKPSLEEEKLANQLSSKLTDIISNCATPGDVSDTNSIRKAMGITIKKEK